MPSPDAVPIEPGVVPSPILVPPASASVASPAPVDDLAPVGSRYIWLMVLAQFGVWVAFITPIAISLAVRVGQLAPGHEEYLGYITGAGALAVMLTSPLFGTLSDRTRTRLGRRRPWMIGGMVLGVVSLFVMALAPSVLWLGFGWILAQLGWGQTLSNLQTSTADRLPESQRGKVAGLIGFSTQIAPVVGVIIASSFTREHLQLQLFLIPGAVGVILVTVFLVLIHEDDSRGLAFEAPLSFGGLFRKYVYSPRQFPDFSWNWLGRFLFYFGLTLNTTFTAFFFASRLHVDVADVSGTIAALAGAGVLATTAGALGGGFLSDRLHRRRIFVLIGAILFGAGAVIMAFAPSLPIIVVGSVLVSMGIGIFAAVDQALLLDVLPEKETDAGRFMGIMAFAISTPQAFAPFIAPLFLAVGVVAGGEKNYTLLYVVAAACTLAGGFVVLKIRSVR